MIVILDYGIGNLNSIKNMIKKTGHKAIITSSKEELSKADKIILPGVGSFDFAMKKIKSMSFFPLLEKKVLEEKIPVLGVCLGAQMLLNKSEEGKEEGLGWITGKSIKFNFKDKTYRVPHMGWNYIEKMKSTILLDDLPSNPRFYFVHSYYMECENSNDEMTITDYGSKFVSGINKENIYGVQFHPEKSHKFGLQLYKNFIENC